jgi:hypothetical protein
MIARIATAVLLLSSFATADPLSLNVTDFGAKADGTTDNTPAFQRALDEAGKTGARVAVPAGRYAINGHLDIPESVTLEGSFTAPARTIFTNGNLEKEKGTILLASEGRGDENGTPFVMLHRSATLKGVIIFYPEQSAPESLTPYPWTVRGEGDNCAIRDVLIVNPWQAVDFGTRPCGRHYINGLYAHALKTGVFVDKCFDVGRIENVHFWPFWRDDPRILAWTREHGTAFRIARTDWEYMTNCFTFAYHVGYHFVTGQDGPGNAVLTQCGADIGPCAVRVDAVQNHAGVSFVNGQFMAGVEVGPRNLGPVKFTACGFWGVEKETDRHAVLEGRGTTTFANCHFTGWSQKTAGTPAIDARAGSLIVDACNFMDLNKAHVELGANVESAVITSTRFASPPQIANHSKGDVAIANNVVAKNP